MKITIDEFNRLVKPIIGMPISLAWKGYGSALFLEIGQLHEIGDRRQNVPDGEISISPNFEWRIEQKNRVVCGSSSKLSFIEEKIKVLNGLEISEICVEDDTRELKIKLANGMIVRSVKLTKGDPEWTIRYFDANYISVINGELFYQNDNDPPHEVDVELEAREKEIISRTRETYDRWSALTLAPKRGECSDCKFQLRIDSGYFISDFRVCSNEYSAFDGKAVLGSSGCPSFVE